MSLYIGNLSEHTRRDGLEHVFRKFGRCNVQLKGEGYGFVVFDFPSDAAKALRALKGRNICGELLTLSWSNKQPTGNFQRFARGGRTYELQRAKNSDRLGYARRKLGFSGWRNQKIDNAGRDESVDVPGEERGYRQDDVRDYVGEEKDYRRDFPDEGGGVVPNMEDNGRWAEPIHDPLIDGGNENAVEFDRYEPYHGYDRNHDNEEYHVGYSGDSPAEHSQENNGRAQIGEETANRPSDTGFQQTCYRCGETGHKMRNCPKDHSSHRNYDRLDVGLVNNRDRKHRVEDENKIVSGSWGKLRSSGNALSVRHRRNERRMSGSQHYHAPLRNELSPLTKKTDRYQRKEYVGKKRSRNEVEPRKRSRVRISKRSISSLLPSDHSVSRSLSNSRSSKSLTGSSFRSRSISVSSRGRSSLLLRSSSKSQYCRGRSLNSWRSSSPTSLSVSLNRPLPSAPSKIQLNSERSSINATVGESADHLVAHGQHIGNAMGLENLGSKYTGIAVNGNSALCTTAADVMEKDQNIQEDNSENRTLLNPSAGVPNSSKTSVTGNLSLRIVKEPEGFWHSETVVMDDIPTVIQKPASQTHANSHSGHSTFISTEEMCTVLKNDGLELPKGDENKLTVDAFFGSARLWPWHIVYYRRLKKGPISTKNYARRVAQNQEFGIVDKYIRSSSGWGELSLENS